MGKKLVIPGADFSGCAVELPHVLLDWVASNTTNQFFDLGVVPTQNMRLEAEVSATQAIVESTSTTEMGIVGCGTNQQANLGLGYIPMYATYVYNAAQAAGNYVANSKFADTDKHVLSVDQVNYKVDGVVKKSYTEGTLSARSYKMYAMGLDSSTRMYTYFHIHAVRIFSDRTDDTSLIHEYVPVKKKDGTICLFDTIVGEYIYVNDGVPDYGEL